MLIKSNIKYFLFFLALIFYSHSIFAGKYDGKWEGFETCSRESWLGKTIFKLTIKNDFGKLTQYTDDGFLEDTRKGKVYGTNKIGLNGQWGRIGGKFLSDQNVRMTYDNNRNCSFMMTKVVEKKTFDERQADTDFSDSDFCKIYPKASPCLTSSKIITTTKKKTDPKNNDFCIIYPKASPCLTSSNKIVKQEPKKTSTILQYDPSQVLKERLKDVKELFEEELINEQEYNQKKQEILDQL